MLSGRRAVRPCLMCIFFQPGDNVHGNLIGTDLLDPVISTLFNGLFAAVEGRLC
ncbi:MAG: hypothetical protein QCH35_00695 [Methanomicrobiaceae archaeon]|nr:hypothetical protein [Methanomicrobiaceae archaeon]